MAKDFIAILSCGLCMVVWIVPAFLLMRKRMRAASNAALELVNQWASENNLTITRLEMHNPYFPGIGTSMSQRVFDLKARDSEGRVRNGVVKCGGYFLGMFSPKVLTRWY
jgi:hypothetical protein